ncbi:Nit-4-like protein [Fusarium napiforme]|uniref:Nit-4-like protein n=1 Tax=Fusarium napiforme TaxID=42672 RepID=A0A8H5IW55_9HYPO|nr:Nit-4-like protein [Fusarium napiforme]
MIGRPTFSQIGKLQRDLATLKVFLLTLKRSSPEEREKLLNEAVDEDGAVNLLDSTTDPAEEASSRKVTSQPIDRGATTPIVSSDDELNIANFISVDDAGTTNSFGPSSALHNPARNDKGTPSSHQSTTTEHVKNELIANAALQRHLEHCLTRHTTIAGEPTELALHLLNLHWARQHHTFLLTYRPAVMRDLECSGPYCSAFMLNAIFACCSKFSPRPDVKDDPNDASSVGRRFFKRCDELLSSDSLLIRPHISTIVGLVLLGSTYNARGETSKGWLYTGYALRMVYDLGLHLDPKQTTEDPEEIEIRRRVFWGAFVCDKLQSLYMGRPVAINLRDSQLSREFLDLYEEMEPFYPSALATGSSSRIDENMGDAIPRHSVSTFQQLCLLSKIMTTIINRFYVVGATFSNAQIDLQKIEQALQQWRDKLPSELDFQPWSSTSAAVQTPNIMVLHNVYHSLIILVHRPFISDDHLRSTATLGRSWEQCTVAARCITSIASVYKSTYGLNGAPYVLAYTVYVACTIHVRNAASQSQTRDHLTMLKSSLECLDELCTANPGVAKPAKSIRRLIDANRLSLMTDSNALEHTDASFDLDTIQSTFSVADWSNAGSDMFQMGDFEYGLPIDPLFGWINVSTPSLDEVSSAAGAVSDPDNEGHNGVAITLISDFADLSLARRPNVVLLDTGTNDMGNYDDAADVASRLTDLVGKPIMVCPDTANIAAAIMTGRLIREEALSFCKRYVLDSQSPLVKLLSLRNFSRTIARTEPPSILSTGLEIEDLNGFHFRLRKPCSSSSRHSCGRWHAPSIVCGVTSRGLSRTGDFGKETRYERSEDAVVTLVQEKSTGRSSTWIRIPDIAQVLRFELE